MSTSACQNTPGGATARRPLHFFLLCDGSGSMREGGKIEALNQAVRDAVPFMRSAAEGEPEVEVLVRAVRFADQAVWHPTGTPAPVESFTWTDLSAGGKTSMGAAIRLVASQLQVPPMDRRGMTPVIVLVSDGQPTDDADAAIQELMRLPWGRKAVRIAIAIGHDADDEVLRTFIGDPERASSQLLAAENADQLAALIQWVSTAPVLEASRPRSEPPGMPNRAPEVPLPPPPNVQGLGGAHVF